jgi:hypothetical protein
MLKEMDDYLLLSARLRADQERTLALRAAVLL